MKKTLLNKESGILSIDFLAGFTIFMLAFIMVVTMVSGIYLGFQSKTIDYDAVAYRTGVILAEDAGRANEYVGTSTKNAGDHFAWEAIPAVYTDTYVYRMGLALPRYYFDTPSNVLLKEKTDKFFSTSNWNEEYYRSKLIFGDYPYRMNITMIREDGTSVSVGDLLPENSYYGSIKRVALLKEPYSMDVNLSATRGNGTDRIIQFDLVDLYTKRYEPEYQIYPMIENSTINFTHLPYDVQLESIEVRINNQTYDCVNDPEMGYLLINGTYHPIPIPWGAPCAPLIPGAYPPVTFGNGTNTLILAPKFFYQIPNVGLMDKIDVKCTFNKTVEFDLLDPYQYYNNTIMDASSGLITVDTVHYANLTPVWIEVRIW